MGKKKPERRLPSPITVEAVYTELEAIAKLTGTGSSDEKISRLAELLEVTKRIEGKWILRTVIGKMRFGIKDMTIVNRCVIGCI